jgi:hypothetical protein
MASMREQRTAWITIPLLFLLFLGGAVLGMSLAERLAPESFVAAFVGLFMLPLAFILGMQFWLGLALLGAIGHGLRYLLGRARGSTARLPRTASSTIPPGSVAFFPIAALSGGVGGLITASVASRAGFLAVVLTYSVIGMAYGLLCWQLARRGWLPFPEPS